MDTSTKLTFCEAIARMEGWDEPSSRCRRNHNPGNLEFHPLMIQAYDAKLEVNPRPRFALFPDDHTGFIAMSHLLCAKYAGRTITQAINIYAPSVENDTNRYIQNVCAWTGLMPSTVLTDDILAPPLE